ANVSAHPKGALHLSALRLTRIFAALMAATGVALEFALLVEEITSPQSLLYTIAGYIILANLALAWGAVVLGAFHSSFPPGADRHMFASGWFSRSSWLSRSSCSSYRNTRFLGQ